MTIFDPIRAAIDAAEAADNAEFDARQVTLNTLKAQAAADAATAAATIADLKAQIIKLTPKPVPDPVPVPVPVPAGGTIFGMNLGSRSVAQRLSQFGRVPMVKQFSLVDVAGSIPEKRAQVCVPWDQTKLAAGDYDTLIAAYLQAQIKGGVKRLLITNRQEPEDFLRVSQANVDLWKAATKRLAGLVKANGQKGVTFVAPCLIAPHVKTGMTVPDAWMLTPDDLGGIDNAVFTLDDYGNPSGAKGGDVYATPYPTGDEIASQAIALMDKFGWLPSWGISEFNTPYRKTLVPADTDHSKRIAYLESYVQACMAAKTPPKHMLLWEEIGTRYDQTFTTPSEFAWWKGYVGKSA